MPRMVAVVCVVQELEGPSEFMKANCPHFTVKEMEAQAAVLVQLLLV